MPAGDAKLNQNDLPAKNNESPEALDLLQVTQDRTPSLLIGTRNNAMQRSLSDGLLAGVPSTTSSNLTAAPTDNPRPWPFNPRSDTQIPRDYEPQPPGYTPNPPPPSRLFPGQRWPGSQFQPRPPLIEPPLPPRQPPRPVDPRPPEPPPKPPEPPPKPPEPPPKPEPKPWMPGLPLIADTVARGGASAVAYKIFSDRLPAPDFRLTGEMIKTLEPHAHTLATSAGKVETALVPPLQDVSVDMKSLWRANRTLPDKFEEWFALQKNGSLSKVESRSLNDWALIRGTGNYVAPIQDEVNRLHRSTDLRYLQVGGPQGPAAGRQPFNIPKWAPLHHPELGSAMYEMETARLSYNSEINKLMMRQHGCIEAERRAAMSTLGGAFVANAAMDYAFFRDSSPTLRTIIGDVVTPLAVMSTNRLSWGGRFATIVGTHFGLKLWDRVDENAAKKDKI